jgi:hypothetical protein
MNQINVEHSNRSPEFRQELNIVELSAELYPDKRRVKVCFQLTPFQSNPNASLTLLNQDQKSLVSVNIINIFVPENEITLHIPAGENDPGEYSVVIELFDIVEGKPQTGDPDQVILSQTHLKTRSTTFQIS